MMPGTSACTMTLSGRAFPSSVSSCISPDFVAADLCTGFHVMAKLQQAFGEPFIPAFVGTVIEF